MNATSGMGLLLIRHH